MKHNNPICNNHFRKDWQSYVKTWFDQPAKAAARRAHRVAKAKKVHPRPVNALRPAVRGQTIKYNKKVRAGRGFTARELRAAGVVPKEAMGLGIAIDYRRKNRTVGAFESNVDRLKAYKAKLVVIPRNKKAIKKTESSLEEVAKVGAQVTAKQVIALPTEAKSAEFAKISEADQAMAGKVSNMLRQQAQNLKFWGQRIKKQQRVANDKAAADKKAAKKSDE